MLEDSHKIWCVTGLPGAGKSSFCRTLVEKGGFECLEKDSIYLRNWDEIPSALIDDILGPRDHFNGVEDWSAELVRQADLMRARFRRLAEITSMPGFNESIAVRNLFLRWAENPNNEAVLDFALNGPEILDIMVGLLAAVEILETAVHIAGKIEKVVLIDDFELVCNYARRRVFEYLNSKGFEPGLVIVRATEMALMKVDSERAGDSSKQFADRNGLGWIDRAQPYLQSEGWSRVLIVDRKDDGGAPGVRNFQRGLVGFLAG